MKKVGIIMAGGAGERFWPFSRRLKPKQLLPLTCEKSMLKESIDKISPVISTEDCFIVTNIILKDAIMNDIREIKERNILCEPMGKNTATCLGFASAVLAKKYGDCVVAVLTADHLIKNTDKYINNINLALDAAAKEDVIVTLGVPPNRPETGYGYIQTNEWLEINESGWLGKVKAFHEKPNLETAQTYLASGDYFWNSGMFFYKNSTMVKAFEKYMPKLYNSIIDIQKNWDTPDEAVCVKKNFEQLESISIDIGIMEKFPEIRMVRADFEWDDIGSWSSLERIGTADENGNIVLGNAALVDTSGSIVFTDRNSSDKNQTIIGLVGVKDMVVVKSGNCILVCPKDKVQEVKKIVGKLKEQNKTEYI